MKKVPDGKQVIAEMVVEGVYNMVKATMGPKGINYAPYIGTLFSLFFSAICWDFSDRDLLPPM
jgi:F0F1-type ATP synthase membrane subunit a